MELKSGIYRITCLKNGNFYIGSAINITKRWHEHKKLLNKNKHINKNLQNVWNKYGEEYFDFDIIEYCSLSKLIKREQHYIDYMKPQFNVCQIAGSSLGTKHTKETKEKISIIKTGLKHTEEAKRKMSNSKLGNSYALGKTYNRISQRSLPDEYIREIRASKLNANKLSKEYGCNSTIIQNIKRYITYKDIK